MSEAVIRLGGIWPGDGSPVSTVVVTDYPVVVPLTVHVDPHNVPMTEYQLAKIVYDWGDGQTTTKYADSFSTSVTDLTATHIYYSPLSADSAYTVSVSAYEHVTLAMVASYSVSITGASLPSLSAWSAPLPLLSRSMGPVDDVLLLLERQDQPQLLPVVITHRSSGDTTTSQATCVDPSAWPLATTVATTAAVVTGTSFAASAQSAVFTFVTDQGRSSDPDYTPLRDAIVAADPDYYLFGGGGNYPLGMHAFIASNWYGYNTQVVAQKVLPALGEVELKGMTLDDAVVTTLVTLGSPWLYWTVSTTLSSPISSYNWYDVPTVAASVPIASATETFETETDTATTFSYPAHPTFSLGGDLLVGYALGWGAGPSDYFLDTYLAGPLVPGDFGTITIANGYKFIVDGVKGLVTEDHGVTPANGSLKFTGTLVGGTTATETLIVNSAGGWVSLAFSGSLSGVYMTSLKVEIPGGSNDDYFALDDFSYTYAEDVEASDGYNDSNWPSASAQFGFGVYGTITETATAGEVYDSVCTTFIPVTTQYFRNTFDVSAGALNAPASAVRVRFKRDDGVVIYINGVEVLRDNMPSGTIDQFTPALCVATSSIDQDIYHTYYVPLSTLSIGSNTIAAEVHQAWPSGNGAVPSDLAFDLELSTVDVTARYLPTVAGMPHINKFGYLPNNGRYYSKRIGGESELFVLNSGRRSNKYECLDIVEPDGITVGSVQFNWFVDQVAASDARWKIVMFYHPYIGSARQYYLLPEMDWGFGSYGVDLVLTGGLQCNEHLYKDKVHLVNCSVGVIGPAAWGDTEPHSVWRDTSRADGRSSMAYTKITSTPDALTVQLIRASSGAEMYSFQIV